MSSERPDPTTSDPGPLQGRYQALFEWAASGMAVTSLDGRFLAANPALCRMLGYPEEELLGLNFLQITHPDDRAENQRLHRELLAGEISSFVVEKRYLTRDGEVVWGRASVALIRDLHHTPLHLATTVEDITSQREAAEQLALSQSLLRVAGRVAKVGGWAVEQPSEEVFWSDEVFGILEAPSGGEPRLEEGLALYPVRDRARVEVAIAACAREGTPFDLEVEIATFTGRGLWVRVVGEAERAADGSIVRVTGAFQDVSELKAARAETEEVAQRLTISLESMTDAVYLLDRGWRFTYLNPRAELLLRRGREELLGCNIWEEFPEAVDTPAYPEFHRAVREGRTVTLDDLYYEPLGRWFANTAYPSSQGLAVYFRDVTEQHEVRIALEEREAMLTEQAALLDETQEAIFVLELGGVVTFWNRGAERIYGWSSEQAVGQPVSELLGGDGSWYAAAACAVVADGVWVGELDHVARDGGELVIESRWTLVCDEAGDPRSILVTDTDVTERRRTEQQLIRSQRMESIGTLAGGIAHDLNNMLAPIRLAIELLSAGETDPQKVELLRTMEGSAKRGAAMVRQVLSFARGVDGVRLELEVADLLMDVLRIAGDTFPRDIRLVTEISPATRPVRGDETQLHQVLMNLLVNARDALPDGGSITCSVFNQRIDGDPTSGTVGVDPGDYVVVEVTDTGHGMPAEVLDRAFEPFFTTKAHGLGTGLGLSTSLAIVESHGGHVTSESEPGVGTTFRVHLPTSTTFAPTPTLRTLAGPAGPAGGTGQLVLVVDDEASVRTVVQLALQQAGYRVLTAADGAEALALYRLRRDDIALVIIDLMMPVMGGSQTIDALRSIDPTVRIIAMSGLADQPRGTSSPDEFTHVLAKPFTSARLLHRIAEALVVDPRS